MGGNRNLFCTLESALVDEGQLHYKGVYLSRGQCMAHLGCSFAIDMGFGHSFEFFFCSHVKDVAKVKDKVMLQGLDE